MCDLGPEKAGTISGVRLVFRVILLYCTRLRNTRHLKGRFMAYSNKIYFFFYLKKKDRAGCEGSQMNRNTSVFRDVEILLHTNRIFVPNSTKHIFRRSGFTLKVTPDFYNLFFIIFYHT